MKELYKIIQSLTASDKKSLSQKALKGAEEMGELAKAVLPFENAFATTHRFVVSRKILEECIDNMLVVMSIAAELGYSLDDVEEMMKTKLMLWARLQERERKADWPVPFEIHITVREPELELFRVTCEELRVKPIVLDLQSRQGTSVLKDVMTSSVHQGNNRSAYEEMERIAKGLSSAGMEVVRKKIETVPWHPAAPSRKHENPIMPKDCYFEAHLGVLASEDDLWLVRRLAEKHACHLSRNIFKRLDEGQVLVMVTYRQYEGERESFERDLALIKAEFGDNFIVDKVVTEFSIYDTKVHHDAEWLKSSDQKLETDGPS